MDRVVERISAIEMRRFIRMLVTVIVVGGCAMIVFWAVNPMVKIFPLHVDLTFPFIHPSHPGFLFRNTTANGGDMGAHVWAPAYLRDVLLPQGRLTGWAPDWFAGFPALHFYFPIPSLLIVLVDAIHIPFTSFGIPYNVAFKLITVLGITTMPISAYIMGRCFRLKSPKPELLAVATLIFLFNTKFTIYGGNITSTLAGEFAFSISLSASLIFLGLYWQALTYGRRRALAAVFLAITIMSHLLPTIFAFVMVMFMYLFHLDFGQGRKTHNIGFAQLLLLVNGLILTFFGISIGGSLIGIWVLGLAVVLTLFHVSPPRLWQSILVGGTGVLLACAWLIPFRAQLRMSNDMGWGKETSYWEYITKGPMEFIIPLALLAFFLSIIRGNKLGILLGAASIASIVVFVAAPQAQLWNARALPFWYLCGPMLAAVGIGEIVEMAAEAWDGKYSVLPMGTGNSWITVIALGTAFIVAIIGVGGALEVLPQRLFGKLPVGLEHLNNGNSSSVTSWSKWNYTGYEEKQAPIYPSYKDAYKEYSTINQTMAEIGKSNGCGRAMWEYEEQEDRFGTPMALMLLPYWTNHCIGSLEGLYFESAASAPYHWIIQDRMSEHGSNPQRDLPYKGHDIAIGVKHLQAMGVRYYLAITPSSQRQADANPDLTLLRTLPPFEIQYKTKEKRSWKVYQVKESDLVTPLANQPVVARLPKKEEGLLSRATSMFSDEQKVSSRTDWLELAMHWYADPNESYSLLGGKQGDKDSTVYLADDGPDTWSRATVNIDNPKPEKTDAFHVPKDRTNKFGDAVSLTRFATKPLEPVTVTNVKQDDNGISFDVDKTGVPVLVRMSYFPNWEVEGAHGPYRSTPNFMIVLPTKNHVSLSYGRTFVDYAGILLTLFGVFGVVWLRRKGSVTYPETDSSYWRSAHSYSATVVHPNTAPPEFFTNPNQNSSDT